MDLEKPIDDEMLEPWHEIEPPYPDFQIEMWQNAETAHRLVVRRRQGPDVSKTNQYEIALLPFEDEEDQTEIAIIEDGFSDWARAVHEAEALMVTDTVEDNAE